MTEQQIGELIIKFLEAGGSLLLVVWFVCILYRIKHPSKKDIYINKK